MNMRQLQVGLPVITASALGELRGTAITPESLQNRESGSPGVVEGPHPRHKGDVWFVDHGNGKKAAYHAEELQIPKGAFMPSWVKNQ
jgi:hypothetical protein